MLRKILWISSILALLPSLTFSQVDLALKIGAGVIHPGARSDRHFNLLQLNRYRILLGLDGAANIYEQQNAFVNLKAETEFSYLWYDTKDWDDVSIWGIKGLLDLFPEVGLDLNGGLKPCFGAGLTLGFDNSRVTIKDIPMYDANDQYVGTCTDKTAYRDFIYGFGAQPSLEFEIDEFSARGAIKYRFFFDNQHYEWKWGGRKESSGNTEYRGQSVDLILSAGINLGTWALEAGLQAENWVFKDEDRKEWPKWPDDWEYMLFGKIHFSP
jgi:hypothetical protein